MSKDYNFLEDPIIRKVLERILQENPEYKQQILDMNMLDDEFAAEIFRSKEVTQLVLRILTDKPNLTLKASYTQWQINNPSKHSVVLDVLAIDTENNYYNIELQKTDTKEIPKRARFYAASRDTCMLEKGDDYSDLKEGYTIFITKTDIIGKGLPLYEYQVKEKTSNDLHPDDYNIMYLNTSYGKDKTKIGWLIHDLLSIDPRQMHYPELRKEAEYLKLTEEGVLIMIAAIQSLRDEIIQEYGKEKEMVGYKRGEKQGEQKRLIKTVKRMFSKGSSIEQIADDNEISVAEVNEILIQLKKEV